MTLKEITKRTRRGGELRNGDGMIANKAAGETHLLLSPRMEIRGEYSMADKVLRAPSFFLVHNFHRSTSMFKATLPRQSQFRQE